MGNQSAANADVSKPRDQIDWLDDYEFYELMQNYRHINQHRHVGEEKTVEAFEAVKAFIRQKLGTPSALEGME